MLDPENFCPFCTDDRAEAWYSGCYLTENKFPHRGTERMLLITTRRHVVDPGHLTGSERIAFWRLFDIARQRYGIAGGALVFRFGNPLHHAGTVIHLHANIIVAKGDEEYRPTLGKGADVFADDYRNLRTFRDSTIAEGGLPQLLERYLEWKNRST
jgi:hypothetical protein